MDDEGADRAVDLANRMFDSMDGETGQAALSAATYLLIMLSESCAPEDGDPIEDKVIAAYRAGLEEFRKQRALAGVQGGGYGSN